MSKIFLTIPGLGSSGKKHWQSHWENKYENFYRVDQQQWTNPYCPDWVNSIEKKVEEFSGSQIYLVAHSLGCIAVSHWAQHSKHKIAGALLVAPPDIEMFNLKNITRGFEPVPHQLLPFKSFLIASSNDEYANISKAWQYARFWGSNFINVGNKGHINADTGFGDWPEGFEYLTQLSENHVVALD